jgi:hypothetical protein
LWEGKGPYNQKNGCIPETWAFVSTRDHHDLKSHKSNFGLIFYPCNIVCCPGNTCEDCRLKLLLSFARRTKSRHTYPFGKPQLLRPKTQVQAESLKGQNLSFPQPAYLRSCASFKTMMAAFTTEEPNKLSQLAQKLRMVTSKRTANWITLNYM